MLISYQNLSTMSKRILKDPDTGEIIGATNLPFSQSTMTKAKQPDHPTGNLGNFKEYKVEWIAEGGCGTILLGASGIPIQKMEAMINQYASDGWQLIFQVIEKKRFLLFWTREAVILTFAR